MYIKTFIVFCFCLCSISVFGQGASYVYDAKNDINQTKQYTATLKNLTETIRQNELLNKSSDLLQKAEDALSRVNTVLNDIAYVEMIVRRQVFIVRSSLDYIQIIKEMKYLSASDVQMFESRIELLLTDCDKLMDMADKILTEGYFKMDDSQRVSELDNISSKLSHTQTSMDIYFDDLKTKNQAGEIKASLKNF